MENKFTAENVEKWKNIFFPKSLFLSKMLTLKLREIEYAKKFNLELLLELFYEILIY